ncbi:MAG: SagB/ThcOx family dehydrogenase [Chloroflexota bacterium]
MRLFLPPVKARLVWIPIILTALLVSACQPVELPELAIPGTPTTPTTPDHAGETPDASAQGYQLPSPDLIGTQTLEEVMARRRSIRSYTDQPLSMEQIGQLLWSAQGITDAAGRRTAPSAGALYPLEMYVATAQGVFHYDPQQHSLSLHLQGDLRPELHAASLHQDSVLEGAAVFIFSAVYERTEQRYGAERTPRYVYMEVGHAAQNLLLQAVALDLGAVPIGAFFEDQVSTILSLPEDHQPVYIIPVGYPDL